MRDDIPSLCCRGLYGLEMKFWTCNVTNCRAAEELTVIVFFVVVVVLQGRINQPDKWGFNMAEAEGFGAPGWVDASQPARMDRITECRDWELSLDLSLILNTGDTRCSAAAGSFSFVSHCDTVAFSDFPLLQFYYITEMKFWKIFLIHYLIGFWDFNSVT